VPIVVFLGLSVLDLGPMYVTDRRQTDRRQTKAMLNASALWERRHNNIPVKEQMTAVEMVVVVASVASYQKHSFNSHFTGQPR